MRRFYAHLLFVLAAWTLVIKYVFPISLAAAAGTPLLESVWWDFWWLAHIALGVALLRWPRWTWQFAMGVSVVEIVIVVTKFVLFLPEPTWDVGHSNWFINKIFVLGCFVGLFVWLVVHRDFRVRAPAPLDAES